MFVVVKIIIKALVANSFTGDLDKSC